MLFDNMRKKSKSIIVYAMFAAIIITFVISFGPGDRGCAAKPNWAAIVNGETITQAEYRFQYGNMYEFYQRYYPNFNATVAKQMNLSQKALDTLVDTVLLAQEAERLGFYVSDKEVADYIAEAPQFQNNGVFDRDLYHKVVQFQLGMRVNMYEEKIRLQLLAKKMNDFLKASVDVSNKELADDFIRFNESIDGLFIIFSPETMKPEARERIEATFSPDQVKEFIAKNDNRISLYYDDHKSDYVKEEEIDAAHILIKVDDTQTDADAKKKIEDIDKEVKAGKDFAALAKQYSQCPSAEKGGDLGYFARGRMVPEFDTAAFGLQNKGDVSGIVKTPFGYHIIKLLDRKPASTRTLDQVKEEIARFLLSKDKLEALAQAEANKALSLLKNSNYTIDDLKKDCPDWDIAPKENKGMRQSSGYIAHVGMDQDLVAKLFAVEPVPALYPEVAKVDDKFVVVKIMSHTAADMNKFEKDKSQYRERMISTKFNTIFKEFTDQLRQTAKIDYNKEFLTAFQGNEG